MKGNVDLLNWTCNICENDLVIKKNVTIRKHESNNISAKSSVDDINLRTIRDDIVALMNKFESVSVTNVEVEKSVSFCSAKLDDCCKKIDSLFSQMNLLDKKVNDLDTKYSNLEKEINLLKINLNKYEQQSLTNNVSISGIPITKNENVEEVIKATAKALNVDIRNEDIQSAYRSKVIKNNNSKIIVSFNNKAVKDVFLNKTKALQLKKQPLKSNQIHSSFPDRIIYNNHELTQLFRKLFWLAKQFANIYGWKYVWSSPNGIYLRKNEGEAVMKLQSISDLLKLDEENKIRHLIDPGSNVSTRK